MDEALARPGRARQAATVTLALVVTFALLVFVLHVLRTDLDPVEDYLSYYAVGRHGWLMVTAFVALGLGGLALAVGLRAALDGVLPLVGCTLLGGAGLGLVVGGVARTDLEGQPATTTGDIHVLAAAVVGLLGLFLGILVLTATFAVRRPWRTERRLWLGLGALMLVGFAAFATIGAAAEGLGQRVLVAAEVLCLLVAAGRLRRVAAPRTGAGPHG